jgi:hypothetical protein
MSRYQLINRQRFEEVDMNRDTQDQPAVTNGNGNVLKVVLALLAVSVASVGGGLIAWGAMRSDVEHHERRLTAVEQVQLTDGRSLSECKANQIGIKEWLMRVEKKLDRVLDKRGRR